MYNIYIYIYIFSSGAPSSDPQHPDYVPSVFNFKEKALEEGEKKIKRYERNIKRVKHDSLNRNLGPNNSKLVIKKKKKNYYFSINTSPSWNFTKELSQIL